ncbi:hypothetical protein VW041_01520 [Phaeobacter sp. JH204A]|uniref:hypothetical protein n=1 Tax=Phaeobacter sp. JH204A TaxID=3112502 RepID=UPI003A856D60
MNTEIFHRLVLKAANDDVTIPNAGKPRWIRKLNDSDSSLMAKSEISSQLKVTRHIRAIQIEYNKVCHFGVLGHIEKSGTPDGLLPTEITPGLFSVIVTESDIQPSVTGLEILDAIGDLYAGETEFDGFDLSDISKLFPYITVYEADQNYEYTLNVTRVLGALIARSYSDGPIGPSASTLAKVSSLFEAGSEHVPFENILQGLLSISWGGFFLELYRAVEQLYAVPRLSGLVEAWPTPLPYRQLADLLESHLSWRPKEDDALAKIIGECDGEVVKSLIDSFCSDRAADQETSPEKVAKEIYKVRNRLVHFRTALGKATHTDDEWDRMISAMLDLVQDIYRRHGKRFNMEQQEAQ